MTSENIERELKFATTDLEKLRDRLVEVEAERIAASAFEDNLVFDRDSTLASEGCLLRMRLDRHGSRLTFKGPAHFDGNIKVRKEYETRVAEGEQFEKILQALGYKLVRRYQKMREEWRIGGVTVALDHTPIGDYVEFEGESADRVARRCGFEPETAERRTYLELYDAHRRENPSAAADMIFP